MFNTELIATLERLPRLRVFVQADHGQQPEQLFLVGTYYWDGGESFYPSEWNYEDAGFDSKQEWDEFKRTHEKVIVLG